MSERQEHLSHSLFQEASWVPEHEDNLSIPTGEAAPRAKVAKQLEFLFMLFVAPFSAVLVAFLTVASQKFIWFNT